MSPEEAQGPIEPGSHAIDPADPIAPALHESLADAPAILAPASTDAVVHRSVAPAWHTALLILAIIAYSFWGAQRSNSGSLNPLSPVHRPAAVQGHATPEGNDPLRLLRYGLSGALELGVVAWVAFGMRLRKVPFRSLFGAMPRGLNNITAEAAIAALFWIGSMVVLLVVALTWLGVQTQVDKFQHRHDHDNAQSSQSAPSKTPQQQQAEQIRELMDLAPANGIEIAAWGFLCLIVGFSEELVFRGYLQAQGFAWLHRTVLAVLFTSLIFGSAHGYQGLRGMCMITVFGALFSIIALLRKNLFPGMLAHSWHDFATGLLLAFIRTTHLLDKLPTSS